MVQDGYWFVVRVKTGREKWASENIERQGFTVYSPLVAVELSSKHIKIESLFPGYLFVFTPNGQWRALTGTFGVMSVVMLAGEPARIRPVELDRLRAREGANGFVVLPSKIQTRRRPVQGEAVRVKSGPLGQRQGICVGYRGVDRIKVLMDFMGGKVSMLLYDDNLDIL
jgi:transcription antitermination factor NusG